MTAAAASIMNPMTQTMTAIMIGVVADDDAALPDPVLVPDDVAAVTIGRLGCDV